MKKSSSTFYLHVEPKVPSHIVKPRRRDKKSEIKIHDSKLDDKIINDINKNEEISVFNENDEENVPNNVEKPITKTPSKSFAIKDYDGGAFVTVYSPVRLSKKKERQVVGSDYVITPVKMSVRTLLSYTSEELEKKGYDQVAGVEDLLTETGFAFQPNKNLN
jgi:hypothetical protein